MPDEPVPEQPPSTPRTLLEVRAPRPVESVLSTGWPMIAAVLVPAYFFALFFPALGGLLLIGAPIAVFAAFTAGVLRARKIRLTVTDEVVRVSSGKAGVACDRAEVHTAVLVDSLARRRFRARTTDLILLDRDGRTALLLSGTLWPPAILERVIDTLGPVPVERVTGKQTPTSLAARYPHILQTTAGVHQDRPRR